MRREEMERKLGMGVSSLNLPPRIINRLENERILNVEDLLNLTPEHVLEIRQLGPKGLDQIYEALAEIGFSKRN